MKLTQKQIIQTILFFGIGLFLVYWQINQLSADELKSARNSLKEANYLWVFLAMLISLFSHWLRSKRWTMLINTAGEKVKPINSFYAVMIGYLANGFLPRLGEIIRCGILSKKENVKFEKLVGTVVAERLFDFIVLIIVVGLTLFIQFDFLYSFLIEKLFKPAIARLQAISPNLTSLLITFFVVAILFWLLYRFITRNNTIRNKWKLVKKSFTEGFGTILKLKNKSLFLGYTLLMWGCYFLMSFLVFNSFDETKHLGIDAGLSVLTSGSLALIVPTPGGLGAYHELVSRTLQLYGVSSGIGVSLSWLIWLSNFSVILLGGFLSLILVGFKNK